MGKRSKVAAGRFKVRAVRTWLSPSGKLVNRWTVKDCTPRVRWAYSRKSRGAKGANQRAEPTLPNGKGQWLCATHRRRSQQRAARAASPAAKQEAELTAANTAATPKASTQKAAKLKAVHRNSGPPPGTAVIAISDSSGTSGDPVGRLQPHEVVDAK